MRTDKLEAGHINRKYPRNSVDKNSTLDPVVVTKTAGNAKETRKEVTCCLSRTEVQIPQ